MEHYRDKMLQGRYHLTHKIGRGGMAVVYLAEDKHLRKSVVVKANGRSHALEERQLFEQEARILVQLDTPGRSVNLPRVHDYLIEVDQGGQNQYLVMDYIEGEDLDSIIRRAGALDEAVVLFWMDQVMEAVEFLHAQPTPVIHRDIKPANIRITKSGERAYLVDFGIAGDKAQQRGTDGFAPPEQYQGLTKDVRSDIYALGATLYALVTGETPPDSLKLASGAETLSTLGSNISATTKSVILKAMALKSNNRYATVQAMRLALQSQIPAQCPSLSGALRVQIQTPQMLAPPPPLTPRRTAYWWASPYARMMRCAVSPWGDIIVSGGDDNAVKFWSVKNWHAAGTLRREGRHAGWVYSLAFSHDGRRVASGGLDRDIHVWDVHTVQPIAALQGHQDRISALAFNPTGQALASAGQDKTLRIWSISSNTWQSTILAKDIFVNELAFSPDGQWLAAACYDNCVRVWDAQDFTEVSLSDEITDHEEPVFTVTFNAQSTLLAAGGADQFIHLGRLCDPQTNQPLAPEDWRRLYVVGQHSGIIYDLAFSPDGTLLVSGGSDKAVCLWDMTHLQYIGMVGPFEDELLSVAFGPNQHTLALASKNGLISLVTLR